MRKSIILAFLLLFFSSPIYSQFNILEKVKKKVNKTVEKNVDKAIDETVDGTEKEIKEGAKKEEKEEKTAEIGNEATLEDETESEIAEDKGELELWSKYNFVPGDKIILEDNLIYEENGEFPSRWDLVAGNAENALLGEDKIINLAQNNTFITPLMDSEEYLPDVFTLEFDAYFPELANRRTNNYLIQFWTYPNTRTRYKGNRLIDPIVINWSSAKMYRFNGKIDGNIKEAKKNWKGQWKHIALSFNKRSLKVFLDESRLLNIPNLGYMPKIFSIGANYDDRYIEFAAIKNIRLAEGGKKLYDRVMSEGKFVTSGILFDVNKATIKPESMGVINEIVKMMKKHGDLNFSVEGHTDSDGDDSFNQTLSEKRAEAVKNSLVELGIAEERLSTKGYGESVPVDNNTTPEGKANNRRVEFVKI